MPELKNVVCDGLYELEVVCANCGEVQTISIPKKMWFIEFVRSKEIGALQSKEIFVESRCISKDGESLFLYCSKCECSALVKITEQDKDNLQLNAFFSNFLLPLLITKLDDSNPFVKAIKDFAQKKATEPNPFTDLIIRSGKLQSAVVPDAQKGEMYDYELAKKIRELPEGQTMEIEGKKYINTNGMIMECEKTEEKQSELPPV